MFLDSESSLQIQSLCVLPEYHTPSFHLVPDCTLGIFSYTLFFWSHTHSVSSLTVVKSPSSPLSRKLLSLFYLSLLFYSSFLLLFLNSVQDPCSSRHTPLTSSRNERLFDSPTPESPRVTETGNVVAVIPESSLLIYLTHSSLLHVH